MNLICYVNKQNCVYVFAWACVHMYTRVRMCAYA